MNKFAPIKLSGIPKGVPQTVLILFNENSPPCFFKKYAIIIVAVVL